MYSQEALNAKVANDIKLFEELFKNYIEESEIPEFKKQLIDAYGAVKGIYEESNCQPLISVYSLRKAKVHETITENEISKIIYKDFRKELDKNFIKPLNEGTISDLYESSEDIIKGIIIKRPDCGLKLGIAKNYAIFEKVVKDSIYNTILPKDSIHEINKYINGLDSSYFEVFERTIRDFKEELNSAVETLTNNLALRIYKKGVIFKDSVNTEEELPKLANYKGLSKFLAEKDSMDELLEKMPKKVEEEHDEESLDSEDIENILNK